MQALINLKSETDLSGFYLVYHGSTLLEKPGTYGISHLMEHLMCKNFEDLLDKFDEDGISWNAYTSSDFIVFMFTGLDELVNKWKYKIYERMQKFNVTQEMLDNERKIVLEEYKDTFNDQATCHLLNFKRKLFGDYSAIGQRESLETLSLKNCKDFFELQFKYPRIVNVSKYNDFVIDDIKNSEIEIKIGKLDYCSKDDFVIYEKTNLYDEKTSIVMITPIIDEKDCAMVSFICDLLGSGLKSPLYQEVREKQGLVYYVMCYLSSLSLNGTATIMTETSNENVNKVIEKIKEILNNKEKYLTQERFDRLKKFYEIEFQKQEIERYKNIDKYVILPNYDVEEMLKQKDFSLKKVYEIYDKYFVPSKMYISTDKTETWN